MKTATATDYTQVVYLTGPVQSVPVLVMGLGMMVADESADTQEFYAGATAPPLSILLDAAAGLALAASGWTYRVRIVRKSDSAVVVDQPATFTTSTDPLGAPILSYGWTAGPIAAGSYWYDFTATHTASGGFLPLPRRSLQVRSPV